MGDPLSQVFITIISGPQYSRAAFDEVWCNFIKLCVVFYIAFKNTLLPDESFGMMVRNAELFYEYIDILAKMLLKSVSKEQLSLHVSIMHTIVVALSMCAVHSLMWKTECTDLLSSKLGVCAKKSGMHDLGASLGLEVYSSRRRIKSLQVECAAGMSWFKIILLRDQFAEEKFMENPIATMQSTVQSHWYRKVIWSYLPIQMAPILQALSNLGQEREIWNCNTSTSTPCW